MQRRMLINTKEPEEVRVAILENGTLEHLYIQPAATAQYVGNIYKGRVSNVERSFQAAFVDIGLPKNAFLHVSDVSGIDPLNPGAKTTTKRRKDNKPIQELLRKGQEIVVQVTKEQIGAKGPSVTAYISLPGRYLVMMPGVLHYGVSRKIPDEEERGRLRKLLDELDLPKNHGFIVRTAGAGARKSDLQRDLRYLRRLWSAVAERIRSSPAPTAVYQESDIVIRCMRDIFAPDIEEIIIDSEEVCHRVAEFLRMVSPSHRKRVKLYRGATPIFHHFKIEDEVLSTFSNVVPLKSGGSIVIDEAEALVAIDVNSGRYTNEEDIEETAFHTNLEAAREAARQLRLRDLGGVIVIDFIDMQQEKHRRQVERTMAEELRRDRARSRMLRMSRFGLLQITRQRVSQGTKRALFDRCPQCQGSGLVRKVSSMVPHLMRQLRLALARRGLQRIEVLAHPTVAEEIANAKRHDLHQLEQQAGHPIRVVAKPDFRLDQAQIVCVRDDGKKIML